MNKTTFRIRNQEDLNKLLRIVEEYGSFNFKTELTAIQILDGAKDMVIQASENDEVLQ